MKASDFPPENMPKARYPCENRSCNRQDTWPPEALRWSPAGEDRHGKAWRPGFYCEACHHEASQGRRKNAPTLALELARRGVVERVGNANAVKLQLVGTLVCFPHDVETWALLEVRLIDKRGKPEYWAWQLTVVYHWPKTKCLPGDLVSVEGQLGADGEGEPTLEVRRVRLLRQDITGEQRKQLLQCEDPLERWSRAARMSSDRWRDSSD